MTAIETDEMVIGNFYLFYFGSNDVGKAIYIVRFDEFCDIHKSNPYISCRYYKLGWFGDVFEERFDGGRWVSQLNAKPNTLFELTNDEMMSIIAEQI